MSDAVTQRVISVIAKTRKIPPETISLDASLEELGIDSLDGLNLIFELEEEFDISIPDEKVLHMSNVRQIVDGLQKLLSEGDTMDTGAVAQS